MISLSLFLCPYCLAYPVQWQLRCIAEVGGFVPVRSAAWGAAPRIFPAPSGGPRGVGVEGHCRPGLVSGDVVLGHLEPVAPFPLWDSFFFH